MAVNERRGTPPRSDRGVTLHLLGVPHRDGLLRVILRGLCPVVSGGPLVWVMTGMVWVSMVMVYRPWCRSL